MTRVIPAAWWEYMNNPEVTVHDVHQSTRFDALEKATAAAGVAIALVMRVAAPLKPIADQVIRSASSVPANLAEGAGRSGRDRTHHYRIAYGSAKEVDTHLRLLAGAGAIDNAQAASAIQLFDDVRAMTWRLVHPKASAPHRSHREGENPSPTIKTGIAQISPESSEGQTSSI